MPPDPSCSGRCCDSRTTPGPSTRTSSRARWARSSSSPAIVGLVYVLRRGLWEDRLLLTWIAVPFAFFEIWPVKGFQYLLPIAPAVAILVGVSFDRLLTAAANSRAAYGPAFDRLLAAAPPTAGPSSRRLRLQRRVSDVAGSALRPVIGRLPGRLDSRRVARSRDRGLPRNHPDQHRRTDRGSRDLDLHEWVTGRNRRSTGWPRRGALDQGERPPGSRRS